MIDDLDVWMSEAKLSNDERAFARVVEATEHFVRVTALRETANPELADEIAQEVFVRAWVRRDQYREGTSPRAWLITITRSLIMDYHRHQERDRRHLKNLIQHELLRQASQWKAEDYDRHALQLSVLQFCLNKLTPKQYELLDLVHKQGLSTSDAADILGIQGTTCRQRLSRLQRAIRQCAEEEMEARHGSK